MSINLLLSSSTALSTPKCCVSGRNEASSNCARPSAHRQLQLCTCQPSSVYNRTATARSEHCSPSRPWSETQSPHHTSFKETPLAACSPTYYIQIATLVHRVQHQDCPAYLGDLVHFTNADCNRSRLRSATSGAATVVRTRNNLGQRPFSVAAPSIWNSLPPSLRLIDSHTVFCRQLKTYLFNLVFD